MEGQEKGEGQRKGKEIRERVRARHCGTGKPLRILGKRRRRKRIGSFYPTFSGGGRGQQLGEAIGLLEKVLFVGRRGPTPLARCLRHLRVRRSAAISTHASPSSNDVGRHRSFCSHLLPCDLPRAPAAVKSHSPHSIVSISWRVTELLVAYCNLIEIGCLKNTKLIDRKLGSYSISPQQRRASYSLHADIKNTVKQLTHVEAPMRGLKSFDELLQALHVFHRDNPSDTEFIAKSQTSAQEVHHDRISVCPNVASIDSSVYLNREEVIQFEDPRYRVLDPPPDARDLPRACHMVNPSEEPQLRRWLFDQKIAFPIPETEITLNTN